MDVKHREILKRQHYFIIGNNSAVKVCTWTKKSLKEEGYCYKQQFYGIKSHRCCQISTTIGYCQNSCIFCWRPMEYTETKEMTDADDPTEVIENSILGQRKLISGLGGYEGLNREKFEEAQEPTQFAISLSGEPFSYPKLAELINELHSRQKTTFVVTNGMLPEKIEELIEKDALPTQLYVSVDAPNEKLFKKIDQPSLQDGWKRLMKTLELIKELRERKDDARTTLRLTMLKDHNMEDVKGWADIIKKAEPMFVEVKAYMFVGFSRLRLSIENMPRHHEVREFAERICKESDYKIIDEKEESRVVLLMKEDREDRIMNTA